MPRGCIWAYRFEKWCPKRHLDSCFPIWETECHSPRRLFLTGCLVKGVESWRVPSFQWNQSSWWPLLLERQQKRKHCGISCDTRDLSLGAPPGSPFTGQCYIQAATKVQFIPNSTFFDIPLRKGWAHRLPHPNSHHRPSSLTDRRSNASFTFSSPSGRKHLHLLLLLQGSSHCKPGNASSSVRNIISNITSSQNNSQVCLPRGAQFWHRSSRA